KVIGHIDPVRVQLTSLSSCVVTNPWFSTPSMPIASPSGAERGYMPARSTRARLHARAINQSAATCPRDQLLAATCPRDQDRAAACPRDHVGTAHRPPNHGTT